jgi:hypothetical protein
MAASSTKRRRRSSEPNLKAKVTGILLLVASTLYLYFLWRTQSFLDTLEEGGRFRIDALLLRKHAAIEAASRGDLISIQTDAPRLASEKASQPLQNKPSMQKSIPNQQPAPQEPSVEDRYIVFIPIKGGQGTGNIIAGLLAAHLLALEFNRTVCVSPLYKTFLGAFEPVNPEAIEKCPLLLVGNLPTRTSDNFLSLINFHRAPNECLLKETLASDVSVLYLESNTYPRWPAIPYNLFFTNYRAKPELLKALPYRESPTMVVHLREPDGANDARKGLDDDSLKALGKMLPRDTYLVTNRVEWYDMFEKEYGWSHPEWDEVMHSAFQKSWGVRGSKERESHIVHTFDSKKQNLQMWCDWYTMLTAKFIYHTHSDFSISAIHWQNIDSRTIMGLNATTGELELEEESWRITGETERLVDRKAGGKGTSDLRLCEGKDRRHESAEEILRQRKQK